MNMYACASLNAVLLFPCTGCMYYMAAHSIDLVQYSRNYGPWTSIGFIRYSCSSSDTSLDQCSIYNIDTRYCKPQYDTVYLACYQHGTVYTCNAFFVIHLLFNTDSSTECTDGDVRLVNGTTSNEGRVEYCHEGRWSALCTYNSFSSQTAYVFCRQLGFISNSCMK